VGSPSRQSPTWPHDGDVDPAHTALLCIDWQTDFCGEGGNVDAMGYDLALTRAPPEPTVRVLGTAVRPADADVGAAARGLASGVWARLAGAVNSG
jgi:biuret amidohydrolase